jgi:hypothetical protein
VVERLKEKRERIAPVDQLISDFLSQSDILEGTFTPGWGGIRNSEVVVYLMYEYERSLRSESGLLSLSPYHEFRKNFEVEHLVPKNAKKADQLENHAINRNRLGNLAVLSSADNMSKSNDSFKDKYNSLYSESSLKILRSLDGPEFTVEDIDTREERDLLPFVEERWG